MNPTDHAKRARAYLDALCDQMDRGKTPTRPHKAWWKVPAIVPVAVGLSLAACGGTVEEPASDDDKEVCDNDIDDDGDGDIDCVDEDCVDYPGCMTAAYGAPAETCDNDVDDDGDGKVDCADSDCSDFPACNATDYAAPFEMDCSNDVDDDGDGDVDCADSDCETDPYCAAAPAYAAPF